MITHFAKYRRNPFIAKVYRYRRYCSYSVPMPPQPPFLCRCRCRCPHRCRPVVAPLSLLLSLSSPRRCRHCCPATIIVVVVGGAHGSRLHWWSALPCHRCRRRRRGLRLALVRPAVALLSLLWVRRGDLLEGKLERPSRAIELMNQ